MPGNTGVSGLSVIPFGGAEAPITWLIRDDFTTNRGAGTVDGTLCEPGPGTRVVQFDPNALIAIVGSELVMTDVTQKQDFHIVASAANQIAGRVALITVVSKGNLFPYLGYVENRYSARLTGGLSHVYTQGNLARAFGICVHTDGATYTIWIVSRGALGFHAFIEGEAYPYPILIGIFREYGGNNTLLGDYTANNAAKNNVLTIRQADDNWRWLPAPLASDSFDRAGPVLGSTDGQGHLEAGNPPEMGGGGDGVAWTNSIGTTVIAANQASASILAVGQAMATIDLGEPDVGGIVQLVARAGGNIGVVVRYTDVNNHCLIYSDGVNIKIDQVLGGVTTNLSTVAKAYAANHPMRFQCRGQVVAANFWNAGSSLTSVLDASLNGTRMGLFSTNVGNIHDDLEVYAGGMQNEYAILDRYLL